jgi:hypothetical protein
MNAQRLVELAKLCVASYPATDLPEHIWRVLLSESIGSPIRFFKGQAQMRSGLFAAVVQY